ncbi:MAG: FHA domain-containing protein [Sedimenticola sp.]
MPKLTLFYKGRMIRAYKLDGQPFLVGRAHACNMRIDSLAASSEHAWIKPEKEDFVIESAGKETALLVNHRPVSSAPLYHGDTVQIGEYSIIFSEAPGAIASTTPLTEENRITRDNRPADAFDQIVKNINSHLSSCIQILSEPHVGKIIPLQRSLTRFGFTGNRCAVIARRNEGYFLSHLEGDSTPLVDEQNIGNRTIQLRDGCIIQIGSIKARFHQNAEQQTALPEDDACRPPATTDTPSHMC